VHLTIADGRTYLRTSSHRYDVIISEPSNPWIGGVASLFSVEYFELARALLKPDGIMLQWVQGYNFSPPDLQMIVKTFGSVFPATSIWHTTSGDYLLLGRMKVTPIDLARLKARYESRPALRRDLELLGIRDWPGVLGFFMLGEAEASRYAGEAALNTDDRLPLEFSAPLALHRDTTQSNWRAMKRAKASELPDTMPEGRKDLDSASARSTIGNVYLARGVMPEALVHFQRARELDPNYIPALLGSAKVSFRIGRHAEALALAQQVLAREPRNLEALLVAGLASKGLNDQAQVAMFSNRAGALQSQDEIHKILNKLAPDGIPPSQ
jgi:tetratricopeptide (TPR) repeat protein